jgi:PAS domain-containing protein
VAIDKNYRLTVFNEVYKKRRKEYDCKEGVSVFDFIPETIHQEWKKYYDRALKGERFQKIQKRQDGRKITFREYSFNPILDEKEEVIGLSVFSKDITEAKQAEAENQKIIQNLIEKQSADKEKIKELESQLSKTVE